MSGNECETPECRSGKYRSGLCVEHYRRGRVGQPAVLTADPTLWRVLHKHSATVVAQYAEEEAAWADVRRRDRLAKKPQHSVLPPVVSG